MATKKRKKASSTKKRSGGKKKGTRKRPRRKTGLSEMISKQGLQKTGKAYFGGAIGGLLASGVNAILPKDTNVFWKVGANAVVALVAGGGFDMPNISAGMGGVSGYQLGEVLTQKLLSEMEEEEMAEEDALSEYPDALDEAGNPMFLADDDLVERGLADQGEFYYLEEIEEMELAEEKYQLAESFQANDMYPRYVNSSMF